MNTQYTSYTFLVLLGLLAGAMRCLAIDQKFAGYVHIPNHDVTGDNDFSRSPYRNGPHGQTFMPLEALKTICEANGYCTNFNGGGWLKYLTYNTKVDSYVSRSSCGDLGATTIEHGSCYNPNARYITCPNTDAYFNILTTYQLPPFLIADACNKDVACAAFMVTNDQKEGYLLRYAGGTPSTISYIRIDGYQ